MPDAVELHLLIPPELGSEAEVLAELRERVQAVEEAFAAERRRTGRRVYGQRAVRQQSWRDQPSSVEPRRTLRPRVAARSMWVRIEALQRNRIFLADYATAREAWLHGTAVMFPLGTYWLRRFANVPIAKA
jgi:ectoine hydroxylase-related dioxygenase (phytanoyl-CoA dioxygenase family)